MITIVNPNSVGTPADYNLVISNLVFRQLKCAQCSTQHRRVMAMRKASQVTVQNERQAKHIFLTRNRIHPILHEIDTRTTKITGDVGIQLNPPTSGDCAEIIG